jgi:hypothetical protein
LLSLLWLPVAPAAAAYGCGCWIPVASWLPLHSCCHLLLWLILK